MLQEGIKAKIQWHQLLMLILIMITLTIIPFLANQSYTGSADLHATIETVGSLLGLVVGLVMIFQFRILANYMHLFLGLGFIINSGEDFVHGILSFLGGRDIIASHSLAHFIPATYASGRLMLGMFLGLALIVSHLISTNKKLRNEILFISMSIGIISMLVTVLAYFIPLPILIFPDNFISRPVDLMIGGILLLGLFGFIHQYYRKSDPLMWWIILSIGVNVIGQCIMSFSGQLFDLYFDIAHVYKVLGYLLPLIGFSFYQITLINDRTVALRDLQLRTFELEKANTALEKRGDELVKANLSLAKKNTELDEKNKELDEFTYVASHDLQEPSRKLVAFSGLLEQDLGSNLSDIVRKDLWFITDAAKRMNKLVQDLLALSRIGKQNFSQLEISLDSCVREAEKNLSLLINERNVKIIHTNLPILFSDFGRMVQLYQNLISNAIKFTPLDRQPIIELTFEDKEKAIFGVKDNGIGINPKYYEKIFIPFQRLHKKDKYEGSGIGLAICRKVVAMHGGKIWIEPNSEEGAHFRFTLL